jgi:hypothetical protein
MALAKQSMRGDLVYDLQRQFQELQHTFTSKQTMLQARAQECRAFVTRYEQSFAAQVAKSAESGSCGLEPASSSHAQAKSGPSVALTTSAAQDNTMDNRPDKGLASTAQQQEASQALPSDTWAAFVESFGDPTIAISASSETKGDPEGNANANAPSAASASRSTLASSSAPITAPKSSSEEPLPATATRHPSLQAPIGELAVGQRVKGRFNASKNRRYVTWYPGVVHALHGDETVTILYDDGDYEEHVQPQYVKVITPAGEAVSLPPMRGDQPPATGSGRGATTKGRKPAANKLCGTEGCVLEEHHAGLCAVPIMQGRRGQRPGSAQDAETQNDAAIAAALAINSSSSCDARTRAPPVPAEPSGASTEPGGASTEPGGASTEPMKAGSFEMVFVNAEVCQTEPSSTVTPTEGMAMSSTTKVSTAVVPERKRRWDLNLSEDDEEEDDDEEMVVTESAAAEVANTDDRSTAEDESNPKSSAAPATPGLQRNNGVESAALTSSDPSEVDGCAFQPGEHSAAFSSARGCDDTLQDDDFLHVPMVEQLTHGPEPAPEQEDFTRGMVATRFLVESLRAHLGERRRWRLEIERSKEMEALLSKVGGHGGKTLLKNMFLHTFVSFKSNGMVEEGADEGGLSAELFSKFFEQALSPEEGLFECDEAGRWLPKPLPADATTEAKDLHRAKLRGVGRVLLKCLLDEYAVGQQFSVFVYGFLLDEHRPLTQPGGALDGTGAALASLGEFAPQLQHTYRNILSWDAAYFTELEQSGMQLELAEFAPHLANAPDSAHLTIDNREMAVYEACKYRLLTCREPELRALRAGFTLQPDDKASEAMRRHQMDLLPMLQIFDARQLSLLIGGLDTLDAWTLIESVDWSERALICGGFTTAYRAQVVHLLRRLLADENAFGADRRSQFLRWVTGRCAIPMGGLDTKIELRCEDESDDTRLPRVQTCFNALYLPAYQTVEVLRQRLLLALDHMNDGFHLQ